MEEVKKYERMERRVARMKSEERGRGNGDDGRGERGRRRRRGKER